MATELTWLGHGSWSIRVGDIHVLLDPFLNDSPTAPIKADAVKADYILVSHGHFDHVADVTAIAHRTGATVVANFEISQWLTNKQKIEHVVGMNLGGQLALPFGTVKMTVAWHSSQLPDGSDGGNPGGFLITLADGTIYFACDTAIFSDMRLIARGGVDLAVLPIGDLFTMGPDDALEAVKLLRPKKVIPNHYNTWPPIEQDAHAWAEQVESQTSAKPVVLEPGGTFTLG
jgi:L-ascorbate metabolism protein UlaG (beta-lactamase superfamily)